MRKIYLASDSKARKKLLKIFGLKFKCMASRIKEKAAPGNSSYAEMVKSNALKKAADVSAKVKSGVIIAADTVVVMDGEVFGKPRDLNSARKMLKTLSGKPQWLYTGLAVIDKDNNKVRLACEKTKIYMDNLTDNEINNYFAVVSPLDKAGSFDIQGKGAFFIRRIEGCFYNVVGLPLRRLYLMLKSLDIKVFIFLFYLLPTTCYLLLLPGCTTEYNVVTGEEETYFYSSDREVTMGEAINREVLKEYELDDDPLVQKRVEDIGAKIAAVCDRKEIAYHFVVLDDEEVNAVSLPGGFVYINKGLIEKTDNDDELAGVIAHEVGHIVARHSIKKLQGQMGYSVLRLLAAAMPQSSGEVGASADAAFTEVMLGYSREDELLADQLGTRYAKLAGYNPRGMLDFLEKLQEVNRRRPLQPKSYYKTHPYVPDRMRVVKQELGEGISFNDYINIEQMPHGVKQEQEVQ